MCRINKPLGFILYENQKAVGPGGSYLDIGWSVYRARGWPVQVEETDRLYTWGDGEIEKFWKQRNTFEISLCADCCSVLLDPAEEMAFEDGGDGFTIYLCHTHHNVYIKYFQVFFNIKYTSTKLKNLPTFLFDKP